MKTCIRITESFTHFNEYFVEKFDRTIINGEIFDSEPYDYTVFCITHIEFPDKEDIKREYVDIYGNDFDKIIIETD